MARPTKQGIDYFPLDCYDDDKIKFIRIKYKLAGVGVVFELFRHIYSQGYWCKWSDDEAIIFSDEIKADYELVVNVVEECLKRDVFNHSIFKSFGALTSKGIQSRYKEACRRRKDIEIVKDYLLFDGLNSNCQHNDGNNGVNDGNNGVNDGIVTAEVQQNGVNDGKSTQSKVKEIKEYKEAKNPSKNSDNFYNSVPKYSEFTFQTIEYWNKRLDTNYKPLPMFAEKVESRKDSVDIGSMMNAIDAVRKEKRKDDTIYRDIDLVKFFSSDKIFEYFVSLGVELEAERVREEKRKEVGFR